MKIESAFILYPQIVLFSFYLSHNGMCDVWPNIHSPVHVVFAFISFCICDHILLFVLSWFMYSIYASRDKSCVLRWDIEWCWRENKCKRAALSVERELCWHRWEIERGVNGLRRINEFCFQANAEKKNNFSILLIQFYAEKLLNFEEKSLYSEEKSL